MHSENHAGGAWTPFDFSGQVRCVVPAGSESCACLALESLRLATRIAVRMYEHVATRK